MALSQSSNDTKYTDDEVKQAVRDRYANAISKPTDSCCGTEQEPAPQRQDLIELAQYTPEQLSSLPTDAVENSFGCGNPLAFAGVRQGDVVLDIGSGAGIDALLASQIVGPTGKVIGLDMTPEMIDRATKNAAKAGATNVEFRLGDAEQMPVDDSSVDWIISNCVINLAPDKGKVFSEVYRTLKPGGRVSISDIVTGQLPEEVRSSLALWASCVGGAVEESKYLAIMRDVGLGEIEVVSRQYYDADTIRATIMSNLPDSPDRKFLLDTLGKNEELAGQVWSSRITARKPA